MSQRYPPLEIWLETYQKVRLELALNPEIPKSPKFLILSGWSFSSPWEKVIRWEEIVEWANINKLNKLLPNLHDQDYEYVSDNNTFKNFDSPAIDKKINLKSLLRTIQNDSQRKFLSFNACLDCQIFEGRMTIHTEVVRGEMAVGINNIITLNLNHADQEISIGTLRGFNLDGELIYSVYPDSTIGFIKTNYAYPEEIDPSEENEFITSEYLIYRDNSKRVVANSTIKVIVRIYDTEPGLWLVEEINGLDGNISSSETYHYQIIEGNNLKLLSYDFFNSNDEWINASTLEG